MLQYEFKKIHVSKSISYPTDSEVNTENILNVRFYIYLANQLYLFNKNYIDLDVKPLDNNKNLFSPTNKKL